MEVIKKMLVPIGLVFCILTGCSLTNEGTQHNIDSNEKTNKTVKSENDSNAVTYEDETKKVIEDNLKTVNNAIEVDNISYKIIKMSVSKKLGEHNKSQVNYLTDEVDKQGNLLGENRFIWLELMVENKTDVQQEIVVNSNVFYGISDDMVVVEADAEAAYISPVENNRPPSERFHCLLKANEKRKLEIGYIIDRKSVKGTLYYGIGSSGSDIDDVNNKFINVEEYWDEK